MITRVVLLLVCGLSVHVHAQPPAAPSQAPTLVLAIIVDQMRYDYLTRFDAEYTGGLRRLLDEGAVFTNANYEAAPTVTAVGHATFLSGATPSVSGIAGNAYYSRADGKQIESITDDQVTPLGDTAGASPHRLLVTTIGDELKFSGTGSKVFGVSLKNRAAILPAGRSADGAFWLGENGEMASSSWYFDALPDYAVNFNTPNPASRYRGVEWMGRVLPETMDDRFFTMLDTTPFADQIVLDFALLLMREENLGADEQTDLLTVSFSATDYLGHGFGTETPMMRAMALEVDRRIGELMTAAEQQAGAGRVLLVLTADHGASISPDDNAAQQLPGGRYDIRTERAAVEAALTDAFGPASWIEGTGELSIYLRRDPIPGRSIALVDMERVAAATLRQQPHMSRVYTRSELEGPAVGGDRIDQRIRNGFNQQHSGDLIFIHEPGWMSRATGTTHGTPYAYDTHVPLIFWGPAGLIKPGTYHRDAAVHDIAPTLSTLLRIARPSGALGRTLDEIIP